MIIDATSNVLYLAGQTGVNLDGVSVPNTGGSLSAFLSKYDLNGNRIWTKAFGVPGSSGSVWTSPQGITRDTIGNIYISGIATTGMLGSVNITAVTAGFIAKFDPNGNQLWINSSAPTIRHEGYGIALDSSGNVYLSTLVNSSSLHQTNNSWLDSGLSVVKYNGSTGAYVSSIMLSSATGTYRGIQSYGGMVIDSSGNVYITASTRSTSYCGTNTTSYNPALIRLDSSLVYQGCTAVPAIGDHAFAFSLHVDNTGAYMSGYFTGSSLDGISRTGLSDAFLTKFTLGGMKLWTRVLGVPSKHTGANAIGYSNGNIFIAGMTGGNLQGNVIIGQKDMFVAKYDPNGNQIWLKMQGIQNDTIPCGSGCGSASIAFDSSGTLYSTASTNGSIGGITNPAGSNLSFFLVRNVQ